MKKIFHFVTTYCDVNGLAKNINDIMIVTAFRHVVIVAATNAPETCTKERTNWIPKYPEIEKINA